MSATTAVWSSRGSGLAAGRRRPWGGGVAFSQPHHGVEDQLVLRVACEGGRKLLAWLAGEIDVVMPHVEIDHAILDVGPHHGVVAGMPDFMHFWPGAEREAGRIDGEQNLDVGVCPQVRRPFVPFVG